MEKEQQYIKELHSACERNDTALLIHYHRLLSPTKNYDSTLVRQALTRCVSSDINFARESLQNNLYWNARKNFHAAAMAAQEYLAIVQTNP